MSTVRARSRSRGRIPVRSSSRSRSRSRSRPSNGQKNDQDQEEEERPVAAAAAAAADEAVEDPTPSRYPATLGVGSGSRHGAAKRSDSGSNQRPTQQQQPPRQLPAADPVTPFVPAALPGSSLAAGTMAGKKSVNKNVVPSGRRQLRRSTTPTPKPKPAAAHAAQQAEPPSPMMAVDQTPVAVAPLQPQFDADGNLLTPRTSRRLANRVPGGRQLRRTPDTPGQSSPKKKKKLNAKAASPVAADQQQPQQQQSPSSPSKRLQQARSSPVTRSASKKLQQEQEEQEMQRAQEEEERQAAQQAQAQAQAQVSAAQPKTPAPPATGHNSQAVLDARRTRNMIPTGRQLRHSPVEPAAAAGADNNTAPEEPLEPQQNVDEPPPSSPPLRQSPSAGGRRLSGGKRRRSSLPTKSPLAQSLTAAQLLAEAEADAAEAAEEAALQSKTKKQARSMRNVIPTGRQLRNSLDSQPKAAAAPSTPTSGRSAAGLAAAAPRTMPNMKGPVADDDDGEQGEERRQAASSHLFTEGPITQEMMARALASSVARTTSAQMSSGKRRRKRRVSATAPSSSTKRRGVVDDNATSSDMPTAVHVVDSSDGNVDTDAAPAAKPVATSTSPDPESANWVATPLDGMRPLRRRGKKKNNAVVPEKAQQSAAVTVTGAVAADKDVPTDESPSKSKTFLSDAAVAADKDEVAADQSSPSVARVAAAAAADHGAGRRVEAVRQETATPPTVRRSPRLAARRVPQPSTPVNADETLVLPMRQTTAADDDRDNTTFNLGRLLQQARQQPASPRRRLSLRSSPRLSMGDGDSVGSSPSPSSSSPRIRSPEPAESLLSLISPSPDIPRSIQRYTDEQVRQEQQQQQQHERKQNDVDDANDSDKDSALDSGSSMADDDNVHGYPLNMDQEEEDYYVPPLGEEIEFDNDYGDDDDDAADSFGFGGDHQDEEVAPGDYQQLLDDSSPQSKRLREQGREHRDSLVDQLTQVAERTGDNDVTVADVLMDAGLQSPSQAYGPLLDRRIAAVQQRLAEKRQALVQVQERNAEQKRQHQRVQQDAFRREALVAERAMELADLRAQWHQLNEQAAENDRLLARRAQQTAQLQSQLDRSKTLCAQEQERLVRVRQNVERLRAVAEAAAKAALTSAEQDNGGDHDDDEDADLVVADPQRVVRAKLQQQRDKSLRSRAKLFSLTQRIAMILV